MKRILVLVFCPFFALAQGEVKLPNGWIATVPAKSLALGDLPLNLAVSPNNKLMAVTNNGQSVQSIQLIDVASQKILDSKIIGSSWYGLKFNGTSNKLYVSGGNSNRIEIFSIKENKLLLSDSILLGAKWPNKISPCGIELDEEKGLLFVVTKEDNSLYEMSLNTKKVINKYPLPAEGYSCVKGKNNQLYISVWGAKKIVVFDTEKKVFTNSIDVGSNPNEILLHPEKPYLFVANANSNSVSVINTKTFKVEEELNTALFPNSLIGASPNGLAFGKKLDRLYIANADNNCLAVFDIKNLGKSKALGFIPVGWYPTNVKAINGVLFVANGKGFTSLANPNGPNPAGKKQTVAYQQGTKELKKQKVEYIGGLFKGSLSILQEPSEQQLSVLTKRVFKNSPYNKSKESIANGQEGNPIPKRVGEASPIKHVFYIIKENRTYDQVLGDMPEGNGDTSLVLFGERITPNQHKLAKEFVLLDNFYVDGEVSADGHNWSTSAIAVDYLEKNWPTSYGGRGGNYDAEGTRAIANPPKGFIWDYCQRAGVSFRTYGEFADDYKENIPVLKDNFCPYYTSWDESVRDTTRFFQWKREFDSLLAINKVPQFNSLRLINDHTQGQSIGKPTVFAHVADNDLAVGMFIEYLSQSRIWDSSVVFILEDDAQNGPDHVDAHRSTAYVAGGFVKRGFVDHTMYSTSSMLRTIELILGLPPMSQYDAAAEPMWRCFDKTVNSSQFRALPANVDLNDKNERVTTSSKLSDKFDFTKEDLIPDLIFSEVIWKAVKGENSIMPAPVRAAFFKPIGE